MQHCSDNGADRILGEYWERQFCLMAAEYGFMFSPMQIGRMTSAVAFYREGQQWNTFTLPDVTIWTAPGQHHEIKHKNPTRSGQFGLEGYRFHKLLQFAQVTQQAVLYTIHNHDFSGGRDAKENSIDHWLTADVQHLDAKYSVKYGASWVNGKPVDSIAVYYWPIALWQPLRGFWESRNAVLAPRVSHPFVLVGGV